MNGWATKEEAQIEACKLHEMSGRDIWVVQDKDNLYHAVTDAVGRYHIAEHGWSVIAIIGRYIQPILRDPDGRLIRAATDVARAQRIKGIEKYQSTLEDQDGYTIGGMIDMVAEELADGSVYVQKVREMYHKLLQELDDAYWTHYGDGDGLSGKVRALIDRERAK